MDLGMIFLCLVIGCLIGFEVGKAVVASKIKQLINEFAENFKKNAEEERKRREETVQNKMRDIDHILDVCKEIDRITKEKTTKFKGDSEEV